MKNYMRDIGGGVFFSEVNFFKDLSDKILQCHTIFMFIHQIVMIHLIAK